MKNVSSVINWLGKLGWGIILYSISLEIGNHISEFNSPKIESRVHLEQLVEEKKKEIGFTGNIELIIDPIGFSSKSYKKDKSYYTIVINKSSLNMAMLNHELYHVYQGHCDNTGPDGIKGFPNKLKYFFYYEPKTIIHTLRNSNH